MTNTLHLPRRHRRPLLFPPGLLALAWLLWLGCAALPQMRGMEREQVLQLWMPPLKEVPFPMYPVYASQQEIERFRPWKTVKITGAGVSDFFALQSVQIIAKQIHDDSTRSQGLRIQFANRATYSSLIQILDWFEQIGIYKYWIDIRHKPITLYTYTIAHRKADISLTCGYSLSYPRPVSHWKEFFHPDWRNTTLFLLLLALLSAIRLYRQYRASQY